MDLQRTDRAATRRTAVLFGASSGIGLATARRLSAAGDALVLVARDRARLETVAGGLPGPTEVAVADLTDGDQVEAALATCVRRFGSVDAVVTSAQPMVYGTVEEVPVEALRRMSDVAVGGTSHLARAALPRFRAQGRGSLVVVSSLLAQIAVPSMGAYCAAKWGQLGLVRSLQSEVRRTRGVHVSLVLPGAVDTPIYRQAATYAGRRGSAPPPVLPASAVAHAVERVLDHPRRMVHVGPTNRLGVLGFRVAPALYDRLAPWLADHVVLRGPDAEDDEGNLFAPRPDGEAVSGGWTPAGRLRDGRGRPGWRH